MVSTNTNLEFKKGYFVDHHLFSEISKGIEVLNKEQLYKEIQLLVKGLQYDFLGPGSKEHISVFLDVANYLDIPTSQSGKLRLVRDIIEFCDIIFSGIWSNEFYSKGDTITLKAYKHVFLSIWCHKNKLINNINNNILEMETMGKMNDRKLEYENDLNTYTEEISRIIFEIMSLTDTINWDEDSISLGKNTNYKYITEIIAIIIDDSDISDYLANTFYNSDKISDHVYSEDMDRKLITVLGCIKEKFLENDGDDEELIVKEIRKSLLEIVEGADLTTKGQVQSRVRTTSIDDILEKTNNKQLDLDPSFQRKDVWAVQDAQKLVISILRGIPLPSIILQKSKNNVEVVVDGKQRITSILRFVGKHPTAIHFVEKILNDLSIINNLDGKDVRILRNLYDENYSEFKSEVKKLGKEISKQEEVDNYLPFKLPKKSGLEVGFKDVDPISERYYCDIKRERVMFTFAGSKNYISIDEIFEGRTSDYLIPVIIFDSSTKSNQIQDIFTIYNKQGKKLSADEIRNAAYHDLPLSNILMYATGEKVFEISKIGQGVYTDELVERFNEITYAFDTYFKIPLNRFGRSKLLSYILSFICDENNNKLSLSTTNRINSLYEDSKEGKIFKSSKYDQVVLLYVLSLKLHMNIGSHWSPNFKNSKRNKNKWEDMQSTSSILGIIKAIVAAEDVLTIGNKQPEMNSELIFNNYALLTEQNSLDKIKVSIFSKSDIVDVTNGWTRPAKSQSRIQNDYVLRVSNEICFEILKSLGHKGGFSQVNDIINLRFSEIVK